MNNLPKPSKMHREPFGHVRDGGFMILRLSPKILREKGLQQYVRIKINLPIFFVTLGIVVFTTRNLISFAMAMHS
jgi:hypothetical protein